MKKTTIVAVFMILLISMLVVSCGSSAAPVEPTPDLSVGKALVESRCNTCHGLGNIQNATYDRETWTKTVDRMVLSGATFSDQEKADIVDYLSATYTSE